MTNNRERIIEQIRKLQDLQAPDSGAFQGEISNAASMMQKLMDKYSISQAEVDVERTREMEKEFVNGRSDTVVFAIPKWNWDLADCVARVTHTKKYAKKIVFEDKVFSNFATDNQRRFEHNKKRYGWVMHFFGDPVNVEIACELYTEWLTRIYIISQQATNEYLQQAKDARKQMKDEGFDKEEIERFIRRSGMGADGRVYRRSWLDGCLKGMAIKIVEQEHSRDVDMENAIVLYDDEVAKAFKNKHKLRTVHNHHNTHSSAGYDSGFQTGSNMNLAPTKKLNVGPKLLKAG